MDADHVDPRARRMDDFCGQPLAAPRTLEPEHIEWARARILLRRVLGVVWVIHFVRAQYLRLGAPGFGIHPLARLLRRDEDQSKEPAQMDAPALSYRPYRRAVGRVSEPLLS